MELRGEFEMNPFDRLSDDQTAFLYSFLKSRGNLSAVQANLQISYPTAKKRLDKLLVQLGLEEKETSDENKEKLDMTNWTYDETSHKASDTIRAKLKIGRAHV